MNVNLGEIEINGVSFGRNTGVNELLCNPRFKAYVDDNSPIDLFTSDGANVCGYTFKVKVFFVNKQIDKIQLFPVNLGMKNPGYPNEKYQEKRKKVADTFLRSVLGKPLKESETVLYYEFDWGRVSSVAFFGGRNEYTGGFIEISYK